MRGAYLLGAMTLLIGSNEMNDCLQCKTIAKENNEKAMESEITRLRERVAHMESALKNIAETSSSTRIRRLAKEALGKGGAE